MALPQKTLEALLRSTFPGANIVVQDLRGDEDHFLVEITAAVFQGKTKLQQHRLVYAALGPTLKESIHALSLKTYILSHDPKN